MAHLIYEIATGRIDAVREMQHGAQEIAAADLIASAYAGKSDKFAALPWDGAMPVGMMVNGGMVVADPSYIPPAPAPDPVPVV